MLKSYAELADGQLHYRHSGDPDAPCWLLLHRTAASSAMYENLMAAMPEAYCIAPDTPGFGASFDPSGAPSLTNYAQWLEEFLAVLNIERCRVFGHHTGANIAIELAHRLPGRIEGLALMGVTYMTPEERAQFKPLFQETFAPDGKADYLEPNWAWVAQLAVTEEGKECLHQEFLDTTRAYEGRVQAFNAVWEQDVPTRVGNLDLPKLFMCAEDEMLHKYHQRLVAELPGAQHATIQKHGCFAPELAATELANQLRRWAAG